MRFVRVSLLVLLASSALQGAPDQPTGVTFNVNSTEDNPDNIYDGVCADAFGKCTLRAAIMEANLANSDPYGYNIVLPAGTYKLTRGVTSPDDHSNGDLDVASLVYVKGAGAAKTIIDANHLDRAFKVADAGNLHLFDLTIENGQPSSFGGRSTSGGAILVYGYLLTDGCVLDSNTALSGGGVSAPQAINPHSVAFHRTTFSRNSATGSGGGFTSTLSDTTFDACTFYLNTSGGNGGGIAQYDANLEMVNTTLYQNDTAGNGGGMHLSQVTAAIHNTTLAGNGVDSDLDNNGSGGGIFSDDASVTVTNSVFANVNDNTHANDDCHAVSSTIAFSYGNLLRSVAGCTYSGFVYEGDPLLGPLKDNGGRTWTAMPSPSSLAANGGPVAGCVGFLGNLTLDQRGVTRPIGSACDLGAVEIEPVGDVNGDGAVNVSDVFYLINFLFAGGSVPKGRANVNGGSTVDVVDVFYLINYLFAGGAAPM